MKKYTFLMGMAVMIFSCAKTGSPAGTTPSNLVITADVSKDSSGSVAFKALAQNAVTYLFEFGDGNKQIAASGIVTYTYADAGSNTYTVTVTATGSSGAGIHTSIQVTVLVKVKPLALVWSDEFNMDGTPDVSKWGYDIGTGGNGWGNGELEYYTNRQDNAIVQGGVLKIIAEKENYSGSAYTSARLVSKDKFDFTYGKIDIRAKLPAAVGTWPALWLLGSNYATDQWPSCGEIDIMEQRGSQLNTIFGTLHYPGHSGSNGDGSTTVISNTSTAFHTYSLDWSARSIKISVDSVVFHTVVNSGSLPFNHNFFFILNVAMGGGFAGNVDPAFTRDSMEVDYIRVYQ